MVNQGKILTGATFACTRPVRWCKHLRKFLAYPGSVNYMCCAVSRGLSVMLSRVLHSISLQLLWNVTDSEPSVLPGNGTYSNPLHYKGHPSFELILEAMRNQVTLLLQTAGEWQNCMCSLLTKPPSPSTPLARNIESFCKLFALYFFSTMKSCFSCRHGQGYDSNCENMPHKIG